MGAGGLAWGIALVGATLSGRVWGAPPSGGIMAPRADKPASLCPGQDFVVVARLPLPLTPPPGVQSRAARKGWRARLILEGIRQADGSPREAIYDVEVFRIRPHLGPRVAGGDVYDLSIKTPVWLPWGLYDVLLDGPGVQARSDGAICLCADGSPRGDDACGDLDDGRRLDLWIPAEVPGVEMHQNGRVIVPGRVAWARVPLEGEELRAPRVAQYHLESDDPVAVIETRGRPCSLTIDVVPPCPVGAGLGWWTLRLEDKDAAWVLWRFSSARWGYGEKVRHAFIESKQRPVAVSFARDGAACRAKSPELEGQAAFAPTCQSASVGKIRAGMLIFLELLTRRLLEENL